MVNHPKPVRFCLWKVSKACRDIYICRVVSKGAIFFFRYLMEKCSKKGANGGFGILKRQIQGKVKANVSSWDTYFFTGFEEQGDKRSMERRRKCARQTLIHVISYLLLADRDSFSCTTSTGFPHVYSFYNFSKNKDGPEKSLTIWAQ
ncbi:hypothetical protein G9A89_020313 [Geosiphon pyriformis]|nr:hypothetical protein G9A89_020313 [Geosiphon pyriformis]